MTTPVGHPDYQAYANWRGPILLNQALSITTVTSVTKTGYCTNFAAMLLRVAQTSGTGMTVTVTYYNDATLGISAGQYKFVLNSPVELRVIVPNLGNYVQVSIFTTQAGTQGGIGYIELCNIATDVPKYPVAGSVAYGSGVSIGAGGSFTAFMPYVVEGDGAAFAQCSSATALYNIQLNVFDESGAVTAQAFRLLNVSGPQNIAFKTGPNPTAYVITNNDASARTFTFQCAIRSV